MIPDSYGYARLIEYLVRMVLVEKIQGLCMESVRPRELPERIRPAILKQCIDAETRIFSSGIRHDDFCPRNIILGQSSSGEFTGKVTVVDFGYSTCFFHPATTDRK